MIVNLLVYIIVSEIISFLGQKGTECSEKFIIVM